VSHITYEQLLEVSSWGIFAMNIKGTQVHDDRLKECIKKSIRDAIYNGIYIGSPGRDIYYMLPYLLDDQLVEVVSMVESRFPKTPPENHVNVGAFIRFIYGQFEKQGSLKNDAAFQEMKNNTPEWDLSRRFIRLLYEALKHSNNSYGMSIMDEMNAHRMGDEALLNNDKNKLKAMEEMYNNSVQNAYKCKSYKQMFTPYYWLAMYLIKFGDVKNAIKYSKLTLKNAEKYCPDARASYVDKLCHCLKYLKNNDHTYFKSFCKNKISNKCVKKAVRKVR